MLQASCWPSARASTWPLRSGAATPWNRPLRVTAQGWMRTRRTRTRPTRASPIRARLRTAAGWTERDALCGHETASTRVSELAAVGPRVSVLDFPRYARKTQDDEPRPARKPLRDRAQTRAWRDVHVV